MTIMMERPGCPVAIMCTDHQDADAQCRRCPQPAGPNHLIKAEPLGQGPGDGWRQKAAVFLGGRGLAASWIPCPVSPPASRLPSACHLPTVVEVDPTPHTSRL